MEPHKQTCEFLASSSLTKEQMEVFRLYQMCGVNMSNEKFQVCSNITILFANNRLTIFIYRLYGNWCH